MRWNATSLSVPKDFSLRSTVMSHGWYDLAPFSWNPATKTLSLAVLLEGVPTDVEIRETNASLRIQFSPGASPKSVRATVTDMFNLRVNVSEFYRMYPQQYSWAKRRRMGRFLRSPTVFEDAVKMLATTNCSWSLTKIMVARLVDHLGETTPSGSKTFPSPRTMSVQPEDFFRNEMRAGYRARYFQSLAQRASSRAIDLNGWALPTRTFAELSKEMRRELGFGPYVVENLLRLLGHFDGLAIDSWCRNKFQEINGNVRGDVEGAIRKHYSSFGNWQGLAMWLDLTRDWHL